MRARGFLIALLAASSVAAVAQTAAPIPTPTGTAAAPTAPRLKARPRLLTGGNPDYPAEALALGHSGIVVLSVLIAVDGSIKESAVTSSSRSPILDKAALDSLSSAKFSPALDADGKPVELRVRMPFEFDRYTNGGEGGTLLTYRCKDFLLDNAWWASVHPQENPPRLYTMLLGLRTLARRDGFTPDGIKQSTAAARKDWDRATKQCTANPEKPVIDYLEQREMLRRIAQER